MQWVGPPYPSHGRRSRINLIGFVKKESKTGAYGYTHDGYGDTPGWCYTFHFDTVLFPPLHEVTRFDTQKWENFKGIRSPLILFGVETRLTPRKTRLLVPANTGSSLREGILRRRTDALHCWTSRSTLIQFSDSQQLAGHHHSQEQSRLLLATSINLETFAPNHMNMERDDSDHVRDSTKTHIHTPFCCLSFSQPDLKAPRTDGKSIRAAPFQFELSPSHRCGVSHKRRWLTCSVVSGSSCGLRQRCVCVRAFLCWFLG